MNYCNSSTALPPAILKLLPFGARENSENSRHFSFCSTSHHVHNMDTRSDSNQSYNTVDTRSDSKTPGWHSSKDIRLGRQPRLRAHLEVKELVSGQLMYF